MKLNLPLMRGLRSGSPTRCAPKRALMLLSAGLLLSLASCKHDADTPDSPPDPDGPVVAPTAYVLDIPTYFPAIVPAPANNPTTVEGVALGRQLFYEKALSLDNTVACASCHRQELAFTDGRARALGVSGGVSTRSAMSLANLMWEPKLTWDGSFATLETQARIPIEKPVEMHQPLAAGVARLQGMALYPPMFRKAFGSSTITEDNTLKALAQFERTLISSNSRYDQFKKGNRTALTAYELEGQRLFNTHPNASATANATSRGGNCGDCHGGELQRDLALRNNGLDATFTDLGLGAITGLSTDNGKFRVPSLRNIALTAPYMHDGRFATLEEVLDHYNEHVAFNSPNIDPLMLNTSNTAAHFTLDLTAAEKANIIAFLQTLTDTTFTHDRRFAKP